MDFDKYYRKLTLLGDNKLKLLAFCAFCYSYWEYATAGETDLCKALNCTHRELSKLFSELRKERFLCKEDFFGSFEMVQEAVIPVLVFMATKRPDVIQKTDPLFKKYRNSLKLYELVCHVYADGKLPKGEIEETDDLEDCLLTLSIDDPKDYKFVSLIDLNILLKSIVRHIDCCHVKGKTIPQSVFEMWMGGVSNAELIQHIADLQAYQRYVQDGVVDDSLSASISNRPFLITPRLIMACYKGEYEICLEYGKILADEMGSLVKGLPPLFFSAYFVAAACLHLPAQKCGAFTKRIYNNKQGNDPEFYLPSTIASFSLGFDNGQDEYRLRQARFITIDGEMAKSIMYLAQMMGRHFDVKDMPYITGESEYAIVRHEVTPIEQQPADLIEAYGDKPVILTYRFKQKWERLIEDISNKLTAKAAQAEVRQSRRIYVLNASRNEVCPMEQNWLKSQKWGKPRELSRSSFSLAGLPNPDKYDEAFCQGCVSRYSWPTPAQVLPLLKGCDRLFEMDWSSRDLKEVKITEEAPYLSIDKVNDGFVVTSNVSSHDVLQKSVVKKMPDGGYVVIDISDKAASVLLPLLNDKQVFPPQAEEKLRSMLAMLDEVVEVRSKLLDRKALPLYKGRQLVVIRLQPQQQGQYEASFCAHPLPDSTKTPPPGEGRKELIDTIADGLQVRIDRDLEGEKKSYDEVCDALDNINGVDLYEDEHRAYMSIEAVLDLMAWVQAHSDIAAIDWLQGKAMQMKHASTGSWNVSLVSNNGWFDIEGDVRIDENTVLTMAQMLDMVQQSKGKYLRLSDDMFLSIDKKLRRQLERIEAMSVRNHKKLQMSRINAAMLDDIALDGEFKVKFDQKLVDLQNSVKDSANYSPEVPRGLKAELRPYQVEGFQWMSRLASWGAGACLADDMGLGKTVQTIAFLLLKASEGPALVIAPASVVPNWASELERFAPSLRVSVLNKAEDRSATIKEAKDYDVILSTYGLLNTEEEAMVEKQWSTICLDEAHTIKNRETKMSYVAMRLQADYRIILTGTPIQNHLGEIWNLFRFINPGLLGGFDTFRQKFVKPIIENNDKGRRKALQGILRPFMLRRTKAEVIDDLPDKNEIVVPVELSAAELTRYEAMRKKAAQEISEAEKVDINTLAEITRLRRAACSMRLVDADWMGEDSKVQAFLGIVAEFKGNGNNRMLVFSQFTSYLDIVRKALDKAGEEYLYLDGSTTMKQREQLVAQFRNGTVPLFLISLKAGGLGLNLPEANYVMHLDPWWNPAIEQQATDRAYRIGQKRDVTVYHLVAKNTIEEKILRLHATKRDLADSLLDGTNIAGKLTVKDILDLISQA